MGADLIRGSILKKLYSPPERSHKGQNGILLVIGGSKKYHGAPLLAIKAASRFVDLLYFHSPDPRNLGLLHFLKSHKSTFITVERRELEGMVKKADCVLIGNGLELNGINKKLVNTLLKKYSGKKKFVLDAAALHMVDKKLLNSNVCVTPHVLEFYSLFRMHANPGSVLNSAKKYGCTILLKRPEGDLISDGKTLSVNQTGNEGMTKGGTGDTLAGLVAAFACKNDLLLSAQAAAFLNGFAGDLLKRERGIHYDADDLAEKIPEAFMQAIRGK